MPVHAKIEFMKPPGSVKDRIGFTMIAEAKKSSALKPGEKLWMPGQEIPGVD